MRSPAWLRGTFSEYVDALRQRFGDAATDVRHELFFLQAGRSPVAAGARALVALLRDAWLLLRHTGPDLKLQGERQVILLVTLAGMNGWGTLQRALPTLAASGYTPLVLKHPRLAANDVAPGLRSIQPARVTARTWLSALRIFIVTLCQNRPLLLACCLARRTLWAGSLHRTLAASRGVLLLHNDFDLMSRAAIGHGLPVICLQHGAPTDEFFPINADWYVVWGATSRQAFEANGCLPIQLVEDSLGRGAMPVEPLHPPAGIALLSQTHAQVLGKGINEALRVFADDLLQSAPAASILLHPLEGQPYKGTAALATRRPPHAVLQARATASQLIVGYCSTAMLDAALAGHWVVALQLPLAGNLAARSLLAAPLRAESVEEVLAIYQRLRNDTAFRSDIADAQAQWLRESFSTDSAGLTKLLQQIEQQPTMERVQ